MYQTRSEDGELRDFHTFKEAFDYAVKNVYVWKISWSVDADPGTRIRLVRDYKSDRFYYEPIDLKVDK